MAAPILSAADLEELRADEESMMQETFTVYTLSWQKVDGLEVEAFTAQYELQGRIAGRSREGDTNTRTVTIGGVERPVVEGGLHIPIHARVPAAGSELKCIALGSASDPSLVGRRWRVVDVPAKSYATARRLDVVEIP